MFRLLQVALTITAVVVVNSEFILLDAADYADHFKEGRPSPSAGEINETTFEWAQEQMPFLDIDDPDILAAYYFRIKTYRSHVIKTEFTDCPWVVSEFGPTVHWGGAYGTINAAAGHQIREGRWIRDPQYMDSFARFWFGGGTFPNKTHGAGNDAYSSWIISAAVERAKVKGSLDFLQDKLDAMVKWFDGRTRYGRTDCRFKPDQGGWPNCLTVPPNASKWPQCYGILDGWDAMEGSISGAGCRPTVNSMMYAEALAIAAIASSVNQTELAANFTTRATYLRETLLDVMWSETLKFFSVYKVNLFHNNRWACNYTGTVVGGDSKREGEDDKGTLSRIPGCPPLWPCNHTVEVRELLGLSPPWYFGVIPPTSTDKPTKYEAAWKWLFDPVNGFEAKWGPTTAERQHKCFNMSQDTSECSWNGMSWPYETARVLTAMSNLLIDYPPAQSRGIVDAAAFTKLLTTYARSHTRSRAANGSHPWVGENIEPDRGFWVAREIMYEGGSHPAHVNCSACARDPRPRNCGGWPTSPDCCKKGASNPCDGKIIGTPDRERGKDYDHSTFVDIVISGLLGFRPSLANEDNNNNHKIIQKTKNNHTKQKKK